MERTEEYEALECEGSSSGMLLLEVLTQTCTSTDACIKAKEKAERKALQYRTSAERLQKNEIQFRMERQTEIVRDFWRNKLLVGQSRSGAIVKLALSKNQAEW